MYLYNFASLIEANNIHFPFYLCTSVPLFPVNLHFTFNLSTPAAEFSFHKSYMHANAESYQYFWVKIPVVKNKVSGMW